MHSYKGLYTHATVALFIVIEPIRSNCKMKCRKFGDMTT